MSFWAGVASGFKDAKAAKAEKEELEARRAERQATFEYNRGRDELLDQRYTDQQAEMLRRWEITTEEAKATRLGNEEWRQSQADQAQANLEKKWKRDDKYAEREWALTLDKFDFQKSSYEDGKAHADKVFQLTIDKFEYGKDQDVIANLRRDAAEVRQIAMDIYQKERDKVGDGIALENRQFRLQQFENQVKQQGITNDQWNQTFNLKKEQIEIERATILLNSGLGASLSGDKTPSKTKRKRVKGKVNTEQRMSEAELDEGQTKFKAMFNSDLTDKEKNSDFFKAAARSSSAQTLIVTFMEAQADAGNPVTLSEVSKHFRYLGRSEGTGEKEYRELLSSVLDGTANVKDKDKYINAMMTLKNHRASKELFIQTSKPTNITDLNAKLKVWADDVETDAYRAYANEKDPVKRKEIKKALAALQKDATRVSGLDALSQFGYGLKSVERFGLSEEPRIKAHYGDLLNPDASSDSNVFTPDADSDNAVTTTANELGLTMNRDNIPVFQNKAEAKEAQLQGFSGIAVVNGVKGNVKKLDFEAKFGKTRDQAIDDSFARFEEAYAKEAEEYGDFKNNEEIAESDLSQEEQMKAMEFIKDDSDAMKEGKPVIATIADAPDDEIMAKYNANLEAIIKQVPKDASREEKIDMILGAFMNSTPDLDPSITEDDIEFLITSALDQIEAIQ